MTHKEEGKLHNVSQSDCFLFIKLESPVIKTSKYPHWSAFNLKFTKMRQNLRIKHTSITNKWLYTKKTLLWVVRSAYTTKKQN